MRLVFGRICHQTAAFWVHPSYRCVYWRLTFDVILYLQGDVEVMDDEGEFLGVELLKKAETLEEVNLITHRVELHETKKGKVLVIQVVSGVQLNGGARVSVCVCIIYDIYLLRLIYASSSYSRLNIKD